MANNGLEDVIFEALGSFWWAMPRHKLAKKLALAGEAWSTQERYNIAKLAELYRTERNRVSKELKRLRAVGSKPKRSKPK